MRNVKYWYYGQISNIMKHLLRAFGGFQVMKKSSDEGNPLLQNVPCTWAINDASVITYLTKNSQNTAITFPKMILVLDDVDYDKQRRTGPAFEADDVQVTERDFDPTINNYTSKQGNSYDTKRYNPTPIKLSFRLIIATTMMTQKLQLLEQIVPLFDNGLEFINSNNPLAWTNISATHLNRIKFTSKNYTGKIDDNVDMCELFFELPQWLTLPAEIHAYGNIETINTEIYDNVISEVDSMYGFSKAALTTMTRTPENIAIECSNNDTLKIVSDNKKVSNWYELFNLYKISQKQYNFVKISLLPLQGIVENRGKIVGSVSIDENDNTILHYDIDPATIPSTNIPNVNGFINPHEDFPGNGLPPVQVGQRYLILEDISATSSAWGEIQNFVEKSANSIIEYQSDNKWHIVTIPANCEEELFVRDATNSDTIKILYYYDKYYKNWVDIIDGMYRPGYWTLIHPKS